MYDNMLRPFREAEALYKESALARELEKHRAQTEQIQQLMRSPMAELDASRQLFAGLTATPTFDWFADHRQLMESIRVPTDLQRSIDELAGRYERSLEMPRQLEELLGRLTPVAGYAPEPPDAATVDELRQRIGDIQSATQGRVSAAVAAMLRWLAANARRIGWKQVNFILFGVVYPLLLTIYAKEVTEFFRPTTKAERRAVEKKVQEAVQTAANLTNLARFRYVRVDALNVRAASRRNSSRVATLHLGDLVIEVRSTKDWTLVEHHDGDAVARGWVLTRHLGRFHGRRAVPIE
jgi:hypothetical protein